MGKLSQKGGVSSKKGEGCIPSRTLSVRVHRMNAVKGDVAIPSGVFPDLSLFVISHSGSCPIRNCSLTFEEASASVGDHLQAIGVHE